MTGSCGRNLLWRTVQSRTMDYSKELKKKVRTLECVCVCVFVCLWFVNVCVCVHVFGNGTIFLLEIRGTEYDSFTACVTVLFFPHTGQTHQKTLRPLSPSTKRREKINPKKTNLRQYISSIIVPLELKRRGPTDSTTMSSGRPNEGPDSLSRSLSYTHNTHTHTHTHTHTLPTPIPPILLNRCGYCLWNHLFKLSYSLNKRFITNRLNRFIQTK